MLALLDAYLVCRFSSTVNFLQRKRRQKLPQTELKRHNRVVTMVYCLSSAQVLLVALELTYPGQSVFNEGTSLVVCQYLTYIVMNWLYLALSLGFLFLFYKVGTAQALKEQRPVVSLGPLDESLSAEASKTEEL